MVKKKISVRRDTKSFNRYLVTVGGKPIISAGTRLTAEREANLLRKKKGRRVR